MTAVTDESRARARELRAARVAANVDGLCPPEHRHGEASTCYNAHGCRCVECRVERQRKRRRPDWEARRLAGKGVLVPAVGAQRRLRALAYMGWSTPVIAERIGSHYRPVMKIRAGEKSSIRLASHRRIDRVFRELAMVRAPGHSGRITRALAVQAGYVPAVAWDEIDDPAAVPVGVGKSRGNGVDRELVEWLWRDGLSDNAIGARIGCSPDSVRRVRNEAGLESRWAA